jgi:hypothetical protein
MHERLLVEVRRHEQQTKSVNVEAKRLNARRWRRQVEAGAVEPSSSSASNSAITSAAGAGHA